jgi:hypothetical protein
MGKNQFAKAFPDTYVKLAGYSDKLDSGFVLDIGSIPEGAKIGDWITVQGETTLILPRSL